MEASFTATMVLSDRLEGDYLLKELCRDLPLHHMSVGHTAIMSDETQAENLKIYNLGFKLKPFAGSFRLLSWIFDICVVSITNAAECRAAGDVVMLSMPCVHTVCSIQLNRKVLYIG